MGNFYYKTSSRLVESFKKNHELMSVHHISKKSNLFKRINFLKNACPRQWD